MASRAGIGLNVADMQRDPRTMAEVSRMLVGPDRTRQEEGGDGHDGSGAADCSLFCGHMDSTSMSAECSTSAECSNEPLPSEERGHEHERGVQHGCGVP